MLTAPQPTVETTQGIGTDRYEHKPPLVLSPSAGGGLVDPATIGAAMPIRLWL